jgi:DNA polymerase
MPEIRLAHETDLEGWREAARRLVRADVRPEAVVWRVGGDLPDLFAEPVPAAAADEGELRVPARFLLLARQLATHSDPGRWTLLYRLLWRLVKGERHLLERASDPDVARAGLMVGAVRRSLHKMKAFLRFKEVWTGAGPRYIAWFEPDHHVLEACAAFFAQRLTSMRWVVVTPYRSAAWDGSTLTLGPGGERREVPAEDALDEDWRAYYRSVFNPARLNPRLMRGHMPKKYWRNMPETRAIPELVAAASGRAERMLAEPATSPARKGRVTLLAHARHRATGPRERPASLAMARTLAAGCRACPLWEPATRTVFGEGPEDARVMLVGEQPGDWEDLEGRPFVGPAGQLLDRALAEAGLERESLYLTNAVKHFKFTPRGKRRLHQSPTADEIGHCRFWLDTERELLRPRLIVALGASAARALLGREVKVGAERGYLQPFGQTGQLLLTVHPAYILRLPGAARQAEEYARLVADLRLAAPFVGAASEVATEVAA